MTRLILVPAMLAAFLQGCTVPPAAAPANTLPGHVTGVLASTIRYEPYTAAELADAETQATIKECEGEGTRHCSDYWLPGDRRTSFTIAADKEVIAIFESAYLSAGAAFNTRCRYIDPAGSVVSTSLVPDQVSPRATKEMSITTTCRFGLQPETPTGRWTVEFAVNAEVMSTLRFDLLAGGGDGMI